MQEILTVTAEVEISNGIQVADACDAIIEQMQALKEHALDKMEVTIKTGNIVTVDDVLIGDWVIEPRKRNRR